MADDRGCFVWYDLMTPDKDAAIAFYREVTGWGTQEWEGGAWPYTMWTAGEAPLGGIVPMGEAEREKGLPPHWLAYVFVPDVDAAATQAEGLGGKVMHPPTDIPGAGRFTVIADPQGAVLALFTPSSDSSGETGPPAVGRFSWHELATSDWRGAFEFYSRLLGWEQLEAMDMGEHGIYQLYGHGGAPLGGMFTRPADMPGPPAWLYYVRVADLDAAAERVTASGGTVLHGPMDVPGGDRIAQCLDPQGAFFALHWTAQGA